MSGKKKIFINKVNILLIDYIKIYLKILYIKFYIDIFYDTRNILENFKYDICLINILKILVK